MTILVTRAQWGARPRGQGTTSIADKPSTTIHWEGGGWKWPWAHSTCDDKVRGIQAYHMDTRGWSDIAYNYLGCPHNYLFEGRGYDRRSSANGNDAFNYASFALQGMWGSSAGAPVPTDLKRALTYGIDLLQEKGHATSVIKGHRDWHETDCPGNELYAWVKLGAPDPDSVNIEDDEVLSTEALRQIATTMVAVLDQEVKDGQSIHELVQSYSAFNALHDDQLVDDTGSNAAAQTELILKDDFQNILTAVQANTDALVAMQTTLKNLVLKVDNTPAS